MARQYSVLLAGREYPLRFTAKDGIALKRRFGKPLATLLREDVMGLAEEPKPDGAPGETHWVPKGQFDLEVQVAFLHAGVVSGGAKLTEDKIMDYIQQHLDSAQHMGPIIQPLWKAVYISGITGASIDPDAAQEGTDEPAPEGKA